MPEKTTTEPNLQDLETSEPKPTSLEQLEPIPTKLEPFPTPTPLDLEPLAPTTLTKGHSLLRNTTTPKT
jgi:hypothetical protein